MLPWQLLAVLVCAAFMRQARGTWDMPEWAADVSGRQLYDGKGCMAAEKGNLMQQEKCPPAVYAQVTRAASGAHFMRCHSATKPLHEPRSFRCARSSRTACWGRCSR